MRPGDLVRLVPDRVGSDDDVLLVSIETDVDPGIPRLIEVIWRGVLTVLVEYDVEIVA